MSEYSDDDDRSTPDPHRFDEEPDFSDDEDFVDEVTDEELMPEVVSARPKESDGVDSVVVVDNVPAVGAEKSEKLKKVLRKIFEKFGKVVNEHYPVEESGKTKGYMFLEFASHEIAVDVVKNTNNYVLDKEHTFKVNLFSDFDTYLNIPEDWEEPKPEDYKDQGNLRSWLLNQDAYDQYSVIYDNGGKVGIYQNAKPDPIEVVTRPRWTETYVKWSPLGTYLVTLHTKGVVIWGGPEFNRLMNYSHSNVQFIDFSPCERYLVTFSPSARSSGDEPTAIVIWETRTGVKKRSFNADGPRVWPIFKWSHDDRFFARMTAESTLSVYETPSFGLLDKKSIKVSGMMDFSWSPTENHLAYWVAEDKDVPARVCILDMPSRNELRVKNLFNVANCNMHWQKTGDFLCVKVDRYNKLRKEKDDGPKYAGLYFNFEIFHMREKQIPVDSVEIKESVAAFAWEPIGSKFAIIHGETQNTSVSFYGVKAGQTPTLLKKYERKTANHMFWSPTGQFIVLAGLQSQNGALEFIDTADFTTMNTGEHFMCSDIAWDPTGRYVMTGVSRWMHKVDNAFWMWSFQGKILKRSELEQFCQFLWRPRPACLLSKKQIKEVKKNLKKYSAEFESQDMIRTSKADSALIEKRRNLFNEFAAYREKKAEQYKAELAARMALRGGVDTDSEEFDKGEKEEEVVEFLVKEEETIVD